MSVSQQIDSRIDTTLAALGVEHPLHVSPEHSQDATRWTNDLDESGEKPRYAFDLGLNGKRVASHEVAQHLPL